VKSFHVLLDHITTLRNLEEFSKKNENYVFSVFLKVDTGYGRAGLGEPNRLLEVALAIHKSDATKFQGIYSHSGHAYNFNASHSQEQLDLLLQVTREEARIAKSFKLLLENNNIPVPIVSIGSTPSCSCEGVSSSDFEGVTEMHPGNYLFNDSQQLSIGGREITVSDCSATVLTRVLSHYPERKQMLIDAGALALSKDTNPHRPGEYGLILGHPELSIVKTTQELGVVKLSTTGVAGNISSDEIMNESKFPIGSLLRIIPNHSCLTAALFPVYYVIDGGEVVTEIWEPCRGW